MLEAIVRVGGTTVTILYHAQLGLPDKDRAIKEFVVFDSYDVTALGPTIKGCL